MTFSAGMKAIRSDYETKGDSLLARAIRTQRLRVEHRQRFRWWKQTLPVRRKMRFDLVGH